MDERRCLDCQRLVFDPNEHSGYDCNNWPDWNYKAGCVIYKEYFIGRDQTGDYQVFRLNSFDPETSFLSLVECLKYIDDRN